MKALLNCSFSLIFFFALGLLQSFILIFLIDNGSQVVIRDLLFTKVYTEKQLESLHNKLDEINYSNYKKEDLINIYNNFPENLKDIIEISNNSFSSQHEKVLFLMNNFSPSFNMDSEQCLINNVSDTTRRVFEAGEGCCSDFAKSAITILATIGIKSREINNNRHTSIEYFNSDTNSWIWIDPSYRLFAVNNKEDLLSAEEIFLSRYGEIKYIEFGLKTLTEFMPFEDNIYHLPNQNNALFYSLDSLDPPLRDKFIDYGISTAITELIFHVTNLRQGKAALMPYGFQSIIFNFAKYSALLLILIGLIVTALTSFFASIKVTNLLFNRYRKNI